MSNPHDTIEPIVKRYRDWIEETSGEVIRSEVIEMIIQGAGYPTFSEFQMEPIDEASQDGQ